MNALFIALLLSSATPDASITDVAECVPGESVSCACTDGRMGAQICRNDGTYAACVCTEAAVSSTVADSGVPPLACDGALCDTTNGATCDVVPGARVDATSFYMVLGTVGVGMGIARRRRARKGRR